MTLPTPTSNQKRWQEAELGLFCHFGINTFHNREWSAGQLTPQSFDPGRFDAAQWADFARRNGFRTLVLTAKHHDGFCLWPTDTTPYSVKNSPCRFDVVGEVARACREAGIGFGLYLSPWDRNAACYGDEAAYNQFYCAQMSELCTRYGELFEIWLDGAGSEGRVYDWEAIMSIIDAHQPGAMVFNMGRPTIRWIGNEDGLASDPCPYAVSQLSVSAFTQRQDALKASKTIYLPPECDVAVRRHWFWQDDDESTLKSKEHLLAIWYRSLGNGANLLLNLGPNRDGLLDERDMARVEEVTRELKRRFAAPKTAQLMPWGNGYDLDFGREESFDHCILREDYARGQSVNGYRLLDESGMELARGETIGHQKWHAFPTRKAHRLRLEWGKKCAPGAALLGAEFFLTGHQTLPQLGEELDYGAWALKADARDADIAPWRAAS